MSAELQRIERVVDRDGRVHVVHVVRLVRRPSARAGRDSELPRDRVDELRAAAPDELPPRPF